MTPPPLDAGSVTAKLALLRQLLDDLDAAGEVTQERLEQDRLLRYAVERILTQLVDLAVAINGHVAVAQLGQAPPDYRSSFGLAAQAGALDPGLAQRLAASVGLRDVLTREYVTVDLEVVVRSVGLAREAYHAYVTALARFLLAAPPGHPHPGDQRE